MNSSQYSKELPLSLLFTLLVIALLGILIFGLNPKDFYLSNNVSWHSESSGIKFGKYGVAYTEPFFETIQNKINGPSGFSLEIVLKPLTHKEGKFNFIIALHNGKDNDQLLIGQWRTHIIFMNGDDYDNKRRVKRVSINTATFTSKELFITVATGNDGTKIYVDGHLFREKKDLTLKIPNEDTKARLIIGNSVDGQNSWKGTIFGLAIYQFELTPQRVRHHYDLWLKERDFSFAKKENPYSLYLFNEKNSTRSFDRSGRNNHIIIPSRMKILKKKLLGLPNNILRISAIQDVILNFLGFIPFGFILTAALKRFDGTFGKHSQLMAVIFGFLLSLTIESIQSWTPTRDSSVLDLILNTLGTLVGVTIYRPILDLFNFRN